MKLKLKQPNPFRSRKICEDHIIEVIEVNRIDITQQRSREKGMWFDTEEGKGGMAYLYPMHSEHDYLDTLFVFGIAIAVQQAKLPLDLKTIYASAKEFVIHSSVVPIPESFLSEIDNNVIIMLYEALCRKEAE